MGGWSSFISVVRAFCLLHVTNNYLGTAVFLQTYGPSMLPTLNISGNLLLAERISTLTGKLRPGDVVILRSPESPRKIVCKRLIGMEGDQVTYVVDPMNSDRCQTVVVPKGHVWVEGDNIYASKDSRNFGAVPYGLLKGRVFWTVLPRKDFGSLAPKPK
ncbi:PREDICTED: mitochondrial inner membrane protease subunit 1 isoform X1 [Theobroma cacao]|uniref:Mitochondrial inner membrane protease subunit 1 isoform X1 n=1 Tax=Theobroma cacao TaxID=3641 RepID=A0AB32UZY2_THECC|nr:PREDICTED: mitochondrial inner membrane protease subunit 1 isoform X1 [Theobroma cacao]XP_007025129.2 PREDICTED: mitochondrial inner membrane protease subunit 1 isoform X1 [Theobroma cacao]